MSKITIVLATYNEGKRREYQLFFRALPMIIKGLSEFKGVPVMQEKGRNFTEIATSKAKFVSRALGLPALADDSGLAVDALNGAPGILSARYAGPTAESRQNTLKLLEEMRENDNRNASFHCVIALATPNGRVLHYSGSCSGIILREPVGENGFGYDPVFYYPPLGKTFAQLSIEEKNRVSHRGQAMMKFMNDFEDILAWLKEK